MDEPGKPRILIPVHSAKRAGAQLVALRQATALAEVYALVIAVGHGPLRPEFAELGEIVRAPTRIPVWGTTTWRWTIDLARVIPDSIRFVGLIRRRRISAVLAPSTVLAAPVIAARLAGVPVVVEAQEAPKSRAARALLRFHGRFADVVIAISPLLQHALAGSKARVVLSYVGVPVPPWVDRPDRPAGAPLRLITVGTIDRHKRQGLAVAALGRLVADGVDATLTFVGAEADPAYAADLKAEVEREGLGTRVHFAGLTSNVHPYIVAADALLLPAGEVTPLVLMEAMARGTAVIATRTGSSADIVGDDGRSGLVVAPDDPAAMAAAVRRLADEPGLATQLAANGRARVEELFDERRSHARLRDLLGEVLDSRGGQKPERRPAVARA
jgi:glycosyltransferase involved in cell wall biosynthesis